MPNLNESLKLVKENKTTFIWLLLAFILLISYLSTKGCGI